MLSQEQVLTFCNKVRKAGGADVLPELLPGIPIEGDACLIANNLNFDCEITGDHDDYDCWQMRIRGENAEEIGSKISEETGMEIEARRGSCVELKLPVELAEVAAKFDNVWEDYESWSEDHWSEFLDREGYKNDLGDQSWLLELSSKFLREQEAA